MTAEDPSIWRWVWIGIGTLLVLALLVHRLGTPSPHRLMRQRMEEDATDPYKRWVQSVFMIVCGECDYAYLGEGEARRMLRFWWNVHGPRELRGALSRLGDPRTPDNAWDLVRFIVVSRLGAGAGYWRDEDCWDAIRPIVRRLQRAYRGWSDMAQAYLHARRQWRKLPIDGSQDDPEMTTIVENIATLRDSRWSEIPYRKDFEESEHP